MRLLRFWIIYLYRFIARYFAELGIAIGLIIIIGFLFINFHQKFFKSTVSEGLVGTYTDTNLPQMVTSLLSEDMISVDSKGQPQPNLIESWKSSSDSKDYTFKLKKNLVWSDGTPVKASDVALSVEGADVSTPDDDTIEVKLDDSYSALPSLLIKPMMKKNSEIGVGPYQISHITYSANSVFVQELVLSPDRDDMPNVVIRFYSDDPTAIDALKIGEVQSIFGVDGGGFDSQVPFKQTGKVNYSRLVTIFYNSKDKVLSDRNFRLALSFAAPSIPGEFAATTSIPPTSWAFNPDVRDYLDNPEQAKDYLSKVKDADKDTIVLTATTQLQAVGRKIVSVWNSQGIHAQLKVENGIPQDFQALLINQDIPIDPDQYSLWQSTQTQTNVSKISSPRLDKDLEEGRKDTALKDRKTQYEDFQKTLLDESPATFLYFPKYDVTYLKKMEGDFNKVFALQLSTNYFQTQ